MVCLSSQQLIYRLSWLLTVNEVNAQSLNFNAKILFKKVNNQKKGFGGSQYILNFILYLYIEDNSK